MISKPIMVKATGPYKIWIKYVDQTEGQVDLSHLAEKPIFQKWSEPVYFNSVYIDPVTNAIAWDENIELCPDSMYLKIRGLSFEQWQNLNLTYATN